MIVMAGQSDRPTARRWEQRTLAATRALAVVALASGLVVLSVQTALFEGRVGAALELAAIARVVVETQAGHVWLVRFGLLVLLAAFLLLRLSVARRCDGCPGSSSSMRAWRWQSSLWSPRSASRRPRATTRGCGRSRSASSPRRSRERPPRQRVP